MPFLFFVQTVSVRHLYHISIATYYYHFCDVRAIVLASSPVEELSLMSLQEPANEEVLQEEAIPEQPKIINVYTPTVDKYKTKMDLYRSVRNKEKYRNNLAKFNMMYKIELKGIFDKIPLIEEKARGYSNEAHTIQTGLAPLKEACEVWARLARFYAKHYPLTHTDNDNMNQPMRKEPVDKKDCVRYLKQKEKQVHPENIEWDRNAKEAGKATKQDEEYFSPFSCVMTLIMFPNQIEEEDPSPEMAGLNGAKRRKMIEAKIQSIAKKDSVAAQFVSSLYAQLIDRRKDTLRLLLKKERNTYARANAWREEYERLEKIYGYYGHLEEPAEPTSPLFSEASEHTYGYCTDGEHFGSGSDSVGDI